jgi:23S rRNA (pseudouridine1915-N3)-methyltransferase
VIVAAIGKAKACPEQSLAEDYAARASTLGRGMGLSAFDLLDIPVKAVGDRSREAEALLKAAPTGSVRVLLDERGADPGSAGLAQKLARWRDEGRPALTIWIGGADGADPALRAAADETWAFGRWTWPHRLVKAMIFEQLYRAVTILSGTPYHRE